MQVKPIGDKRSVNIDTKYLKFVATVAEDGTVEVHEVEVREPRTAEELLPPKEQQEPMKCEKCSRNKNRRKG